MIIVGRGDIATVLAGAVPHLPDYLYFAAGVSNSGETQEAEYQREADLLMTQPRSAHVIYFSSLCVFYSATRYAMHKVTMELMVRSTFPSHTIMRLGNITWGVNPSTLLNHLREQKRKGEPLDIQDVIRYVIDRKEFLHWVRLIPAWPCEMNVPGRRMTVAQIVEEFVA